MGQIFSSSRPRPLPSKLEEAGSSSDTLPHHGPVPGAAFDTLSVLTKAKGHYWYPNDGHRILDACGGAGVACIGHGREEVVKAAAAQMKACAYTSYAHFRTEPVQKLFSWLIDSTGGKMQKAYLMCSGSEAVEAALKLSREYFVWTGQPQRVNFISRGESYHGTTLGSLSASGHYTRRAPFSPLLSNNFTRISPCNAYRQTSSSTDPTAYLVNLTAELESAFLALGPTTVAAVILEPVVGAALGCVPSIPGYLAAVKSICQKYGALLIFDEVMCGMGRTGTLHAWQAEGVVPDLQTIAKGFGGGYQPASALLVGEKVATAMREGDHTFTHGHTYQNHPVVAAAALKVQEVIQRDGLLRNVQTQGKLLERLLKERLAGHPNVGNIRGRGLFWGVEFVKDKKTKEPFDPELQASLRVFKAGMKNHKVVVYASQGCAGGGRGDHIMIMPAYDVSSRLIVKMVDRVTAAVEEVFPVQ